MSAGPGVVVADIRPRAAGVNLSVDVQIGKDWANLPIGRADAVQPRVDRITVEPTFAPDSGTLHVTTGTPTSGADLRNRRGLACLPEGHWDIGYVLVRPGATFVGADDVSAAWVDVKLREIEDELRR